MDKCKREKDNLYSLKKDNIDNDNFKGFQKINNKMESYYIIRSDSEYCMEYYFDTLPELKKMMDNLWMDIPYMDDIKKVLLVSAMKNKPQKNEIIENQTTEETDKQNLNNKLPMFIYNF